MKKLHDILPKFGFGDHYQLTLDRSVHSGSCDTFYSNTISDGTVYYVANLLWKVLFDNYSEFKNPYANFVWVIKF